MIIITENHFTKNQIWKLFILSKFLKNTKPKNSSNFSKSWSIFEFLFASISFHHHLQLFVEFGLEKALNRDCTHELHQWQVEFSRARSGINWTWAWNSTSWSLFRICLKPKRVKNINTTLPFQVLQFFESHDLFEAYVRFKVHFMWSSVIWLVLEIDNCSAWNLDLKFWEQTLGWSIWKIVEHLG